MKRYVECSYKKTFETDYQERYTLNPLRFLFVGVKGNIIFYFLGMNKAFLLDRIKPDWKFQYWSNSIDNLIINKK
jgi:hypothetical protein